MFDLVEPRIASSLCCFAAVSEMAWEWEEFAQRIYRRFFTKHGKMLEPTALMILFGIHHVLGCFAIPMNLYYYDEYYYWTLIGVSQVAATVALVITEYSYYLDITTYSGLLQMKIACLMGTSFMIGARGFYYV